MKVIKYSREKYFKTKVLLRKPEAEKGRKESSTFASAREAKS